MMGDITSPTTLQRYTKKYDTTKKNVVFLFFLDNRRRNSGKILNFAICKNN